MGIKIVCLLRLQSMLYENEWFFLKWTYKMYWTLDCATVLWVDMAGVALFLQLANDQSAPGSVVHVVLTVKLAQT